ncbi:type II toxin-antitoxin system PemK/MazF family toxin [Pelagibacterium sp. 26DY04]|uniref:type II toxin-antitoxin system PemK/MazF family toxin n=1 Tax=Pelagibacterium sp. 26DY04 TaxID=2967130 RepID=UPI002815C1C5|nr:type II toxin-antitoxin system PemK/MazF family toxin [Pelagibacterium sp. 26DY04]WMT88076.1 type II toxin-antitoxin system PemK/MazF family toxin [Pelagibacterium sp. 26DY04]
MKSSRPYVPDRYDVVWLDFDPQAGREQAGRRPAFVLSPANYNRLTGLFVVCPMTNQVKGYPFEVLMPEGYKVGGAILSDHLKSLSWQARNAEYICACPEVGDAVLARVNALLEGE